MQNEIRKFSKNSFPMNCREGNKNHLSEMRKQYVLAHTNTYTDGMFFSPVLIIHKSLKTFYSVSQRARVDHNIGDGDLSLPWKKYSNETKKRSAHMCLLQYKYIHCVRYKDNVLYKVYTLASIVTGLRVYVVHCTDNARQPHHVCLPINV